MQIYNDVFILTTAGNLFMLNCDMSYKGFFPNAKSASIFPVTGAILKPVPEKKTKNKKKARKKRRRVNSIRFESLRSTSGESGSET